MDMLAEKLGMDPLELRYKNAYRKGCTTPTGQEPDVYCIPTMIDMLRPEYKEAKKAAAQTEPTKNSEAAESVTEQKEATTESVDAPSKPQDPS